MRASKIVLAVVLTFSGCQKTDPPGGGTQGERIPADSAAPEGGTKEALPAAADLLEKSVEASGGREKIGRITSFHFEGEVVAPALKIKGKVETWWKNGDFYMVQEINQIGTNRSGKKGDVIWTEEPINGLRKLSGKEAEQHSWASSLLLAADWEKHFAKAETTGVRDESGKKLYDIKLTSESGAELTLSIDSESNLVQQQAFDVVNPMGVTPVKMDLSDYQSVDGIKIPFKQESDLGLLKLSQQISNVELNVDVDSARFAMPTDEDTEVVRGDEAPAPGGAPELAGKSKQGGD